MRWRLRPRCGHIVGRICQSRQHEQQPAHSQADTHRTDYRMGTPSANLTSQTKCTGLTLSQVTIGNLGEYTFQQGFSKEERTGFINRKPGKVSKSCIIRPACNPAKCSILKWTAQNIKRWIKAMISNGSACAPTIPVPA